MNTIITRALLVIAGIATAWVMTPRKVEEKKCLSYPSEHFTASMDAKVKPERKW